jgi:hypothetical protein
MDRKDVRGKWIAVQSNNDAAHFDLRQDSDGGLSGTAHNNDNGMTSLRIGGRVTDTDFLAIVTWNTGAEGEYSGRFGLDGRLTGVSFDRNDISVQASWFSNRNFGTFLPVP